MPQLTIVPDAPSLDAAARRMVSRPKLLARLGQGRDARLTVIEAPAGYGKSQLLGQWRLHLERQGERVLWLTVTADLADPERFVGALTAALALSNDLAPPLALTSDLHQGLDGLTAALARAGRLTIILDDYDTASNAALDTGLCRLLDRAEADIRWIIVSRGQLHLPLGSHFLTDDIVELGVADLRFSDAEIELLFGPGLSAEELATIANRTEGWPVAVQLVRHYLAQRGDAGQLSELLDKADGDLARYLTKRVLGALPELQREVLIKISFLEEFDCELVSAVTGIPESWKVLRELEQSNVLIAAVTADSATYRCHKLLRQVMFAQLRRRGRAAMTALHAAASAHYEAAGNLPAAVAQASAAGNFDRAAKLIQDAGALLYGIRCGSPALQALLQNVPPELLSSYPRLALAQMFVLVKESRLNAAADLLRSVQGRIGPAGTQPEHTDRHLVRDLAIAEMTFVIYGGADIKSMRMDVLEAEIRVAPPEDDWLRGVLNNVLCVAHYRQSDWQRAIAAAEASLYYYGLVRSSNGVAHMHLHLGIIAAEAADPATAQDHYESARRVFQSAVHSDEPGCAMADIMTSEALYEQGQFAAARLLCDSALKVAENAECHYELLVAGYRTMSALAAADAGPAHAVREMAGPLAFARRRGFTQLERFLQLRKTELELMAGEASAPAIEGAAMQGEPGWRELDLQVLTEARLALNLGDVDEAAELLHRQVGALSAQNRVRARVYALGLLAIVLERAGRHAEALKELGLAVGLARPGGLVAPFLEQGRELLTLLAQLVTSQGLCSADPREVQFVNRVIQTASQATASAAGLFSQREEEIVALLAKGTNNKLIARALGISPDTVRFHLKHIYEKFGVSDRKIVAELARESGLVA